MATDTVARMTYRERRERRAERLREWADKREARAAATFKSQEWARGDIAFNTQPGHFPLRDRMNAAAARESHSLNKARGMSSKADNIEHATEHAIYDDDPDARERLTERIAGLEAKRDRYKVTNKEFRATHKRGTYNKYDDIPHQSWELTNLSGNINRLKKRLSALEHLTTPAPRILTLRYAGECNVCDATLDKGTTALYSKAEKTVTCVDCYRTAPPSPPLARRITMEYTGRTMCMQVSVDIVRWGEDALGEMGFERDGKPISGKDVIAYLDDLKTQGYTVLPCSKHECDEKGKCQGEPTKPTA